MSSSKHHWQPAVEARGVGHAAQLEIKVQGGRTKRAVQAARGGRAGAPLALVSLCAGCAIGGRPTSTAAAPSSSASARLSGSDASLSIDATRLPAAAAIALRITCERQLASSEAERQREPS